MTLKRCSICKIFTSNSTGLCDSHISICEHDQWLKLQGGKNMCTGCGMTWPTKRPKPKKVQLQPPPIFKGPKLLPKASQKTIDPSTGQVIPKPAPPKPVKELFTTVKRKFR